MDVRATGPLSTATPSDFPRKTCCSLLGSCIVSLLKGGPLFWLCRVISDLFYSIITKKEKAPLSLPPPSPPLSAAATEVSSPAAPSVPNPEPSPQEMEFQKHLASIGSERMVAETLLKDITQANCDQIPSLLVMIEEISTRVAIVEELFKTLINVDQARQAWIATMRREISALKDQASKFLAQNKNKFEESLKQRFRSLELQIGIEKSRLDKLKAAGTKDPVVLDRSLRANLILLKRDFRLLEDREINFNVAAYKERLDKLWGELTLYGSQGSEGLKLLETGTPRRSPGGLYNLGNSCYINAVLSAFRPFLQQLVEQPIVSGPGDRLLAKKVELRDYIARILTLSAAGEEMDMALKDVLYSFRLAFFEGGLSDEFRMGIAMTEQQDAADFLLLLLEKIFCCQFKQTTVTEGVANVSREVLRRTETLDCPSLRLNFPSIQAQTLQKLVAANFATQEILQKEYAIQGQKVTDVRSTLRVSTPPFMVLQLIRYTHLPEGHPSIQAELEEEIKQLYRRYGDETLKQFKRDYPPETPQELLDAMIQSHFRDRAYENLGYGPLQKGYRERKINAPIEHDGFVELLDENGAAVRYRIRGIMIHGGENPSRGHWTSIAYREDGADYHDDHEVIKLTPQRERELSSQGCLYLLERV